MPIETIMAMKALIFNFKPLPPHLTLSITFTSIYVSYLIRNYIKNNKKETQKKERKEEIQKQTQDFNSYWFKLGNFLNNDKKTVEQIQI